MNEREKDAGGGVNYLCMHPKPEDPEGMAPAINNGGALISLVEYMDTGVIDKNQYQDAGCVVCQRAQANAVYTEWRRKSCTEGHQLEYYGIIMSSYFIQQKTEWICVDWDRAYHATSDKNNNDQYSLLYSTEMEKGAAGDEYGHDKELSCAV